MRAWLDGVLLNDPSGPAISLADHGFTVGDGVFEAIKVVDGQPFAIERHLDRLLVSAAGLGLPSVDLDAVRAGVAAVLDGHHLALGRIRITVTAGPAPLGSGRGDHPPAVAVVAAPMDPMPASAAIVTVPWRRNEHGALAGLKTTSYAENVVALAEARRRGASEAVFANLADHLCEGTGSNVFYVVDGELRTPTLASGCLAGVTRRLVLDWFGGREVDEPIQIAEQADEVFLVSTTRDVQSVVRWGDRELETGPVTQAVAATWRAREGELLGS
ncbi:MAG: aminotransferase class IV [Nocardioides sp.]